MIINRKIKLDNNYYYIRIDCVYKRINNINRLCLTNYSEENFDCGDLSVLIEKVENNYNCNEVESEYGNEIRFLSDCLYIYNNIPFVSGIGDYYISSKDNVVSSASYISKEELNNYIKENSINFN